MAVTWASAVWMLACGRKKILMTPTPFTDCDSMCSMSLTVMVMPRSELVDDAVGHLAGRKAGVVPYHADDGDVDVGEDVDRRAKYVTIGIRMMMTIAMTTKV